MTTTAGEVDLKNRLRLTFRDDGDPRIDAITNRLERVTLLCEAATWLTAYASGVPVSPVYERMAGAPMSHQRRIFNRAKLYSNDPRVILWPPVLVGAPGWAIPRVVRLAKQSPMMIDLVFDAIPTLTAGGGVTALLIAALKNPGAIGGWLPSVATSWHQGRAQAIDARLEAARAQARSEMYWESQAAEPDWVVDEQGELGEMLENERRVRDVSGWTDQEVFMQLDNDRDDQIVEVEQQARRIRASGLSLVQDQPLD